MTTRQENEPMTYSEITELYHGAKQELGQELYAAQYVSTLDINEMVCRRVMDEHSEAIIEAETIAFNALTYVESGVEFRQKLAEWLNIMKLIRGNFIVKM